MRFNGKRIITFDIETEGFGFKDDFVSGVFYDGRSKKTCLSLEDIKKYMWGKTNDIILVTYYGENWKGGFDFPFLRKEFMKEGLEWCFAGVQHLDLCPLIKKRLNTGVYETKAPSRSSMSAGKVKELAKANKIEYTNKKETYKKLEKLEVVDWLGLDNTKCKERNDQQSVYQLLFDQGKQEEYIDGGEVPRLYKEIKELEDKVNRHNKFSIIRKIAENWNVIITHNVNDVVRLMKVVERSLSYLPEWEVEKCINTL